MNLMKNGVADYIVTGQWAKKAAQEAEKYGKVNVIASSADKTFSYIPDCSDLPIDDDAITYISVRIIQSMERSTKNFRIRKARRWLQMYLPVSCQSLTM